MRILYFLAATSVLRMLVPFYLRFTFILNLYFLKFWIEISFNSKFLD